MATSSSQRRIVAAILLATLVLGGFLVSSGVSQLVASAWLPLDPEALAPPPSTRVAAAVRPRADPIPILRRNIFDHEGGPMDRDPEPEGTEETEAEPTEVEVLDPNAPPPACEGGMRLVGGFVRLTRPELSFAAITSRDGEALLYQAGMEIEDRTVAAIRHEWVALRASSGSLCSLRMFDDEPNERPPSRPIVRAPERPPLTGRSAEGVEINANDITRVSDRQFTINRSLVNRLLSNQAAMMRTARVIPHQEGGRTVGVKLYGIRRNSLLGRLGINNGDMLRTINGYDMTSPDSALEAYSRLRAADRITIQMVRRGSPVTLDYTIR